ncbi:hypothetical protein WS70_22025 [Burkholderia mayonis]|uniref:Uncharacterized protein n=1 Tax=Burkholderia mayonis TaxID=1385591 RepID=A0A1B4FLF3_9BURK|nr:hypothetical protein WS70_22025 [Burkholderia mayonis]KVE40962.1 hypothetical protein WS70_15825 [Burkholderia mayonis]
MLPRVFAAVVAIVNFAVLAGGQSRLFVVGQCYVDVRSIAGMGRAWIASVVRCSSDAVIGLSG